MINRLQMKHICLFLVMGLVVLLYFVTGIGCPILYTTGIPCPGCGMSRACLHLLMLDFPGAFRYHPLCCFIPFAALFLILHFYGKINEKHFQQGLVFMVFLFFAVYFIRLKNPADHIVKIHLQEGSFYRTWHHMLSLFLRNCK